MKFALILLSLLTLTSCGKDKSELVVFEKSQSDYNQFINAGPNPGQPNLSLVKRIVNDDYPIEIALYQDGTFYYHLENLGDGTGTYKYENGILKLTAKRKILSFEVDMNYTFTITQKDGSESVLKFRDRRGNQVYKTKLIE